MYSPPLFFGWIQYMKKTNQQKPKRNGKMMNNNHNSNNTVLGRNAKTVSVPISSARVSKNQQPKIIRKSKDEILVSHREYITEVRISEPLDFQDGVKKVEFNPGLPLSFPWLSSIATAYESYRFDRVSVHFETSLPTTTEGAFIMAFDYDASDGKPLSKTDFLNYEGAVKGPLWSTELVMSLDAKRLNKLGPSRYVRGGTRSGTDIKTYDAGNLFYTIINNSNTSYDKALGDIFIEYTVLLQTPQLNSVELLQDSSWKYIAAASVQSNASFFAPGIVSGNLPIFKENGKITLNFVGRYLLSTYLKSSNGTSIYGSWTASGVTLTTCDLWPAGIDGGTGERAFLQLLEVSIPGGTLTPNFTYFNNNDVNVTIAEFAT